MRYDEALRVLNHEADYEEKIVGDLSNFLISSLDEISDFTEAEKKETKKILDNILSDSKRHEVMFRNLIDMILNESPEDC